MIHLKITHVLVVLAGLVGVTVFGSPFLKEFQIPSGIDSRRVVSENQIDPTVITGKMPAPHPDVTTWKTIQVGVGPKSPGEFYKALVAAGFAVGKPDEQGILSSHLFQIASSKTNVDLVKVTAEELGFLHGAAYKEIYAAAAKFGLKPCPAEVGPQLRLQYKDQPMCEWLILAMDPVVFRREYTYQENALGPVISATEYTPSVYVIAHEGNGLSLMESCCANDAYHRDGNTEVSVEGWSAERDHGDDVWVFMK